MLDNHCTFPFTSVTIAKINHIHLNSQSPTPCALTSPHITLASPSIQFNSLHLHFSLVNEMVWESEFKPGHGWRAEPLLTCGSCGGVDWGWVCLCTNSFDRRNWSREVLPYLRMGWPGHLRVHGIKIRVCAEGPNNKCLALEPTPHLLTCRAQKRKGKTFFSSHALESPRKTFVGQKTPQRKKKKRSLMWP